MVFRSASTHRPLRTLTMPKFARPAAPTVPAALAGDDHADTRSPDNNRTPTANIALTRFIETNPPMRSCKIIAQRLSARLRLFRWEMSRCPRLGWSDPPGGVLKLVENLSLQRRIDTPVAHRSPHQPQVG